MDKATETTQRQPWSAEDSAELYGVKGWGAGHFRLSPQGNVQVCADTPKGKAAVDLIDIISGVRERGVPMPLLLRIENLLDAQITLLNQTFAKAIKDQGYRGQYRGVFPIKVNQQSQIIEEIARFGSSFEHGLEAGSKAELLIALAVSNGPGSNIVCNGYKDEEFISLGLRAQKLGYKVFFVLETPAELPLMLKCSKDLNIKPRIGVRVKISSIVSGHWNATSGDRSIFGLTTSQLVDTVDVLRREGYLDCLQLLHVHLGSQIPNIRDIRAGVMEACRYYVDLVGEGAQMGFLDLGGGLAVDYDGSQSNQIHSKNYSLEEYCADIVDVIMTTLDQHEIAHPTIITESGRALVAYGSVLLFNILDVTQFEPGEVPAAIPADEHQHIHDLQEVMNRLEGNNVREHQLQESYNDALFYRDEIRTLFRSGQISLRSRALAENLFLKIMQYINRKLPDISRNLPDLDNLAETLSDIYYGNFSVFQSLPDIWAIDQVFPIMPIHRLTEEPTREATIADITCDCDGKIDKFSVNYEIRKTLPLHPVLADEEYYLGVFLVGAYQETLGDLHNLLGDTHVVSIRINDDGSYDFVKEVEGDSVHDVLSYVEYNPQLLLEKFRNKAEDAVRRGDISAPERQELVQEFSASLRGYTYFER